VLGPQQRLVRRHPERRDDHAGPHRRPVTRAARAARCPDAAPARVFVPT
jgi:hypothetical protein